MNLPKSEAGAQSRLHRPYYRNGPSHRDGADVSFQDIRKLFGFASITVGRWVTKQEQQLAANLFFDALYDLQDILAVNEQVISLSGTLSLAFGHGGSKHSSAHYNANNKTLALAKNAGGGALAHEWFHAFDDYIGKRMFANTRGFASAAWLNNATLIEHPLNDQLNDWFSLLFLDAGEPSDYLRCSVAADKALGGYYYAMPQELAARAFEACIQDHSRKNAFLVQGTKQSTEAKVGIYPRSPLREQANLLIQQYFYHLGIALSATSDRS